MATWAVSRMSLNQWFLSAKCSVNTRLVSETSQGLQRAHRAPLGEVSLTLQNPRKWTDFDLTGFRILAVTILANANCQHCYYYLLNSSFETKK